MRLTIKNFVSVLLLLSITFSFESCLNKESDNYQSFSEIVGTIVTVNSIKLFRCDDNGTLLYSNSLLSDEFPVGNRFIISGTIDYNDQPENAIYLKFNVSSTKKINIKQTFSFDTIEKDTFKNDVILGQTWSYIVNTNNKYFYTSRAIFYASNQYHAFDFVNNRTKLSDTLKFELRHNSKLDTENSIQETNVTSFDLTPYLDSIPKGKTKILQISYKTSSGLVKQNISFKKFE